VFLNLNTEIFVNKKMSIDTKQLIHVAIETTVISVLFVYFYNKNKVLCEQINELENIVAEQQETLQKHERMILNMSNSIKSLQLSNTVSKVTALSCISTDEEDEEPEQQELNLINATINEIKSEVMSNNYQTIIDKDNRDVHKTESKKKKKKKRKKNEQQPTEQMLDAELLEELKDLQ
jgi:hypothetical protein